MFGATSFKEIRETDLVDDENKVAFNFKNWTETEIRLRICRLLRCYDLKPYEGRKFNCEDEIFEEAKINKQKASDSKQMVGGILYNPPAEIPDEGIFSSFFNSKKK
jgi:hypothetical protein